MQEFCLCNLLSNELSRVLSVSIGFMDHGIILTPQNSAGWSINLVACLKCIYFVIVDNCHSWSLHTDNILDQQCSRLVYSYLPSTVFTSLNAFKIEFYLTGFILDSSLSYYLSYYYNSIDYLSNTTRWQVCLNIVFLK